MNRTILFFTVLGVYCIGAGSAVAQKKLPYKEVLEATVSSGGNIEVSPSVFYPDADFSIDFSAKLGQGSDGKVAVLASNSHAFGANLTISSEGIKFVEGEKVTDLSHTDFADGQEHHYRVSLDYLARTLYIYVDGHLEVSTEAFKVGDVEVPEIYDEVDSQEENTGIYDSRNLLRNPGFEDEDIVYSNDVTGSDDYMFWPKYWDIYNGGDKENGWNVSVRCYKDNESLAVGREGHSALMFRQDGGGGYTKGSSVFQTLESGLRAGRRYVAGFKAMSHSNAAGFTYAVGVGTAAGTWNAMYDEWKAPANVNEAGDYAFAFTVPADADGCNVFGVIGADTRGIVHLDRMYLVECAGPYNTLNVHADGDAVIGNVSFEDMAFGSEKSITNVIYAGGEYYLYNTYYNKLLGDNEAGNGPALSAYGKNADPDSYVFVAEKSSLDEGYYWLKQKSTGRYLQASNAEGNTWSVWFAGSLNTSYNSYEWSLNGGTDGFIMSKRGETVNGNGKCRLGVDAGADAQDFVNVYYDKTAGEMSRWLILEAGFPVDSARLQVYRDELAEAIIKGEGVFGNPAFGSDEEKEELAVALYNARSAQIDASVETIGVMEEARKALLAAIDNVMQGKYSIWVSGSSFQTERAFTVAMNGTELSSDPLMEAQLVIRNSYKTGAQIGISHGRVSINGTSFEVYNASGMHDYQFAFDGEQAALYFDGQLVGTAPQKEVGVVTSVGTSAEWTILGLSALKAYNPEIVSSVSALSPDEDYVNEYGKAERNSLMLVGQSLSLDEPVDLHVSADTPMKDSKISINSEDAWIIFDNVRPSDVISKYLSNINVDGQPATNGSNCRVAIYLQGAAVIPHKSSYKPFYAYSGQMYSGDEYVFGNGKANVGQAANEMQSFILKRGYMVCLATNADGSGYSRVYVADHEDKCIPELPQLLDRRVSYINVRRWNYVSKKGWCSTEGTSNINTEGKLLGTTWFYTWSADRSTQTDMEYVPIKQHKYWPSWNEINSKTTSTHVLGINEPDHSEQHTSDKCSCGGTTDAWTACTLVPDFFESGMRIGSPAPTDAGWLKDFIGHCNDMAYRCDFVAFHAYWGTNEAPNADSWKNQLQSIYNNTKRPIWLTEWNNGASWTTESWPSNYNDQLAKQRNDIKNILEVLDNCDFIERYSIYNWDGGMPRYVLHWDSNKNNWWVTPAGEVYRDARPSHAYKESMQYIPNGWLPGLKTDNKLSYGFNAARLQFLPKITNKNGDITETEIIEYLASDGTYKEFYKTEGRSGFDNTGERTYTVSCDSCPVDAFLEDDITLRLKITTVKGETTTSEPVTMAVPAFLKQHYTGIDEVSSSGLEVSSSEGCISISSDKPCRVMVFNVAGILVSAVECGVGRTDVPVSAGTYIVGGRKVLVE